MGLTSPGLPVTDHSPFTTALGYTHNWLQQSLSNKSFKKNNTQDKRLAFPYYFALRTLLSGVSRKVATVCQIH